MSSATIAVAKEERENYSGRKMIQAFKQYCANNDVELSAENLETWDGDHNEFKIRETFGSRDEVYNFGLRESYRIYLTRYSWICAKVVKGKKITAGHSGIRKNSLGVQQDTATMNRIELDYQLERERALIKNAYLRVKLFGLDVRAYRKIVDEALAEFE